MPTRMLARRWFSGILLLGVCFSPVSSVRAKDDKPRHTAVDPVPRGGGPKTMHARFLELAKRGGVDLLFLGDSITDAWGGEGHDPKRSAGNEIFTKEFEPLKAANFGIGGDRTQHVLWRLQNGEMEGIQPKVVMLMIGTNNSNRMDNTAEEIAEGVATVVKEIHKRSPKAKVLLLAIFPRGAMPNPQREKIKKVNDIIAKLDDGGKTVKYLDIGAKFMQPDGSISKEIMPDYLHLSPAGYRIWADAVKGPIQELLSDAK